MDRRGFLTRAGVVAVAPATVMVELGRPRRQPEAEPPGEFPLRWKDNSCETPLSAENLNALTDRINWLIRREAGRG